MKKMLVVLSITLCVAGTALALTAQQEKMKDCNAQASEKQLKGDARKQFMSTCLGAAKQAPQLTAQQQKMKTCNQQAGAQHLTGDQRKQFMSTCLSGK